MQSSQINQLKHLLAADDVQILAQDNGGNSKVFCAKANEKKWAIKSYPPYAPNQRDRLAAESIAYQFLNQYKINAVPTFKAVCESERWLIIDWIDGQLPNTYSDHDIQQAIEFIRQVAALNHLPEAKELPSAAEACLSLDIIINQITKRLERLESFAENEPLLTAFLKNEFTPLFDQRCTEAIAGYLQHQIDPKINLSLNLQSLIPADFGFHNALRDQEGKLYFFDFDYFGWDDPVKLLADILWHPKMKLSVTQKQHFIDGIANVYHYFTRH